MKKITKILLTAALSAAMSPALAGNILTEQAHEDFHNRFFAGIPDDLFYLLASDTLTDDEDEALQFMYASMPSSDIADYTPEFFLENIRASLQAREQMPWGKTVPDREFRHFVLPIRTNNENLDMSRPQFYAELRDRVKGLSMQDAILEVNHWCHEKATYQPSDGRTNSPLATVCSALGRCGEESTFTVAALRAVGIPARQVYTPRWAHTDDNHAWVEAWADGRWWFLGACEPEPILDLGWFNAPASRGMLMNTKVFGNYDGPEEQLGKNAIHTTINVTSNYAPTSYINVTITDRDGHPVENATVNFSLYNYAEFYPIAVKRSDKDGNASLLAGHGDLVVWASDGRNFGIAKANAAEPVTVELKYDENFEGVIDFDIVPPPVSASLPKVTAAMAAENDRRKAYEDSLRMAYTATFYTPAKAKKLAKKLKLDEKRVANVMTGSRGNWRTIESFLLQAPKDERQKALALLENVSTKDLNDITAEVLADNIAAQNYYAIQDSLFNAYVMSPRISNELLTPFRAFLTQAMGGNADAYCENPGKWVKWIAENIAIDTVWNPQRYPISPKSVWERRSADTHSRDIFFVAGARTAGIPARINDINGKTQYLDASGEWIDVDFGDYARAENAPAGVLNVVYDNNGKQGREPRYYSQFAITKVVDGMPVLQEYGEDLTVSELHPAKEPVDAGQYMLMSGQRMADGKVLARARFYKVNAGETAEVPLQIRHDETAPQVIGNFDSETLYRPRGAKDLKSILSTTGRGYYILAIVAPGHEPSAHALNDISALKKDFEQWGKKIMVVLPYSTASRFDEARYPHLPANAVICEDPDGRILRGVAEGLELQYQDLPIVVIADTFNRIVYYQQGYTIGLGEKLIDVINQLEE